uniref:Uncharacterized protein n=1 Tax=Fagus sylvatica TaxID=28930 RepID=A0A2N9EAN8_FAGSY
MSYTPTPPIKPPPPPTASPSPVPYSPIVPSPPTANHYAHPPPPPHHYHHHVHHKPPPPPPVVGVAGAGALPYQFVSANYGGYQPAVPAPGQPQKPSIGKKLAKVLGKFLCGFGKMAIYDEVLGDGTDF